jgi:predicted aspartyl protease
MPKEIITMPINNIPDTLNISVFLIKSGGKCFKPNILSLSTNINCMNRTIVGKIDEHGFAYINVNVVSPSNDTKIAYNAKAIIDTGAAYCLIKRDLIEFLNIEPFKKDTNILHPIDGVQSAPNYYVNLMIDIDNNDGAALLQQLRVGIIHLEDYPSAMIIGVELLKYCKFTYNAKEGLFELNLEM